MLKLPFFNRERYIVVKAYAMDKRLLDNNHVSMTSSTVKEVRMCSHLTKENPLDFTTCYGYTKALDKSITISSWSEVKVKYDGNPDNHELYERPVGMDMFRVMNVDDGAYKMLDNSHTTKIIVPWMFDCNKRDAMFVMTKHIYNRTPMMVVPGMLNFHATRSAHIFNQLSEGQNYKIPYKHPLAQIFSLSDLPLHLETRLDPQMFQVLFNEQNNRPFFRGTAIKVV